MNPKSFNCWLILVVLILRLGGFLVFINISKLTQVLSKMFSLEPSSVKNKPPVKSTNNVENLEDNEGDLAQFNKIKEERKYREKGFQVGQKAN